MAKRVVLHANSLNDLKSIRFPESRPRVRTSVSVPSTSEAPAVTRSTSQHRAHTVVWPENLRGDALFRWAMSNVRPIPRAKVYSSKPRVAARPASDSFEAELLNEHWNVVWDLQSEYIENSHPAVSRAVMRKLRGGEFSVRAQFDLHGMTQKEARDAVLDFVKDSARRHLGCVRIIHGKGNNSRSKTPILKERLQEWLFSRRLSPYVLAYTSARPCDGGTGAIYVLLKKV